MPLDRKTAARKAAAAYHTNIASAVVEYAKLTEQADFSIPADIDIQYLEWKDLEPDEKQLHSKLEKEMLSLLPAYRHPRVDEEQEKDHFLFITPVVKGRAYQNPMEIRVTKVLKERNIKDDIIQEVVDCGKELQETKLELIEKEGRLAELEAKFERMKKINETYKNEKSDKRYAKILQELEIAPGRPGRTPIEKGKAYRQHLNLVRAKGMFPEDAARQVQQEFGFQSLDATLKALYDVCSEIKKLQKSVTSPSVHPIIDERFSGLIPGRKNDR